MATEFITFSTANGRGEYTIRLREPVCLYNDSDRGYRAARARAARHIKRQLELHPCSKVEIAPHDWSDGVDALSEKTLNA